MSEEKKVKLLVWVVGIILGPIIIYSTSTIKLIYPQYSGWILWGSALMGLLYIFILVKMKMWNLFS